MDFNFAILQNKPAWGTRIYVANADNVGMSYDDDDESCKISLQRPDSSDKYKCT